MKTTEKARCEVTVKRPDGTIETIIHPQITRMNDALLSQMRQAMKKANRGEVVGYKNIDAVVEAEESDYQGHCKRCGKPLDTRKAHPIDGYMSGVKVRDYICDECNQIKQAMTEGR